MDGAYHRIGAVLGAEIGTVVVHGVYCVRIEATPAVMALIAHLDVCPVYITPAEDSGHAWFQFVYTDAVDAALVECVDLLIALRRGQPQYGQLRMVAMETAP